MKAGVADFTSWYEIEAPAITKALGLALGDHVLAEEAMAEAFIRAFARWEQVRVMHSPIGWVYQVALNQARGRFRRRRLEDRVAERRSRTSDVSPPTDPDDALWAAVRALPNRARTAVALRYVADLPEAEIAVGSFPLAPATARSGTRSRSPECQPTSTRRST